jgi:predicted nucleotide-binding protein
MSLPIMTSIDDCEKVLAYLKSKPTGATLTEARSVLDPKLLDGRKIHAYEAWGLLTSEAGRLTLTAAGRDISRDPSRASSHYRHVIDTTSPYRSAVERGLHAKLEALLLNDVAANWHEHHLASLGGSTSEDSIKGAVTCFFSLAEGAGLGAKVLGRRGQETRLDLHRGEVEAFVAGTPVSPARQESADESPAADELWPVPLDAARQPAPVTAAVPEPTDLRVFITHGRNTEIVEQIETMLGVADVPFEVAIETETAAIPVPEKVLSAMRRCTAAIICVSVEEDRKEESGSYAINENVLIEIGAAFVLYNRRVILLWDRRLKVPSNLQGLYRCEFEGDEIGFKEVMRLMMAVKEFRTGDQEAA